MIIKEYSGYLDINTEAEKDPKKTNKKKAAVKKENVKKEENKKSGHDLSNKRR